jgi:hypothetical protein
VTRGLITHSRQDCFKSCRRKHYYRYELGLRRTDDSKALRMGKAFHDGIAALGRGESLNHACHEAGKYYANMPGPFDAYDWDIERETVLRLVCAYEWRWSTYPLEYLAVERGFRLPLLNPATGQRTPAFDLAGKIDAIVRLPDGRLAVKESKCLGDDIGPDAPLWRRMRMDSQISLYIHAARRMGFNCDTVLYDVARKPTIKPEQIAILDGDGLKIVLDANGNRVLTKQGKPRQTGSADDGYTLQTRPMTPDEWGEKLTADICERPAYYFARVEVPRMDADVNEYQSEIWDIQRDIRDAQKGSKHYRTVNRNTCGYCEYFDVCSGATSIESGPPAGFELVSDLHPELEIPNDDRHSNPTHAPAASPAAAPEFAAV